MGGNKTPYVPPAKTAAEIQAETAKELADQKAAQTDTILTNRKRINRSNLAESALFVPSVDPTPGPVAPKPPPDAPITTPVNTQQPSYKYGMRRQNRNPFTGIYIP